MHKSLFIVFLYLISNATLADSDKEIVVWSEDKTALAFCELQTKSVCFVVCNSKFVNVSIVELSNLGKLGSRNEYEKVVTYPSHWESNDELGCMFWFKTHAWLDGQRYTATEPVYVTDGRYDGR